MRPSPLPSVILVLLTVGSLPVRSAAADEIDFNRDVRPILSNHCFQCHGPDDETREAGLRLDVRESALAKRDGTPAVVAGKPAKSLLVARITSKDEFEQMPPKEFGKPLSAEQIETLKTWIVSGAEYAGHWSFQPVKRSPPPVVAGASHPIDAFVRRRLGEEKIEPSPPADRYTLIRRVHLDLLGLPPSVADVDAFVNDRRPDAYERMVDRVLASPHYGERWGRHWLDQARYADSHGYTNDNARTMWPYRDWVIAAFNRDLPFDEFTVEQLAGDLLENPTLDQRVATGFHRNTLINSEGGTKADQFRDEQVKDRTDTTGLVWMGLTVGCAKCHTHKFDPISQREYYELYSFFDSTADANSVRPQLQVPSALETERIAALEREIADLQKRIDDDDSRDRQQAWEKELLAKAAAATAREGDPDAGWTVLPLSGKSLHGSKLTLLDDNSLLVAGPGGQVDEYHAIAPDPPKVVRSVRLQVLTDDSLPKIGPGRAGNGNFVLSEFWFRTGDGQELRFNVAGAEHSQPKYEVTKAIDGKDDTGWAINGAPEGSLNRNRTAWFVLPKPLEVADGDSLTFKLQFHQKGYGIGRFRISVSDEEWQDQPDVTALAVLAKLPEADRSDDQKQKLRTAFMQQDPVLGPLQKSLARSRKELDDVRRAIPTTMVMQELDKPRQTHVQVRGEFLRIADPVQPGVPAVLPPLATEDERADRLELARWLTSPDHPLTSRVRVNRIWMRLFGQGLVETENDFGTQGTLPTHPELFEWLADEFQRLGWSQKRLVRRIVTSETYRQSSVERPDLATIDPRNLLLARQNRVRVEAEIVRDVALEVSGRRSTKIGGPSVHPPQEAGVYAFTQRKKSWRTSTGDDRFRRGLYTFFYRSAPYPMLETFDVPKFNTVCTSRDRSNTPIQSLTMSNATAMVELAGHFGERITSAADGDAERLEFAFRTCFARPPSPGEQTILTDYLQQSRDRFDDESKAWMAVARLLMNVDEFLVRE